LEYGSSDPDVVFSKSLKSASDLPTGSVFSGTGAGSQSYSAEYGLNLGDIDNRMDFISAFTPAQKNALNYGGHLTCEVSRSFIDVTNVPALPRYFLQIIFTNAAVYENILSHTSSTGKVVLAQTNGASNNSSIIDAHGKSDMVRIDMSWTWSSMDLYIEGIHTNTLARSILDGKDLTAAYIGGRASALRSEEIAYMRNLQVSTRPIQLPVSPVINNIAGIGDSISVQADYPASDLAITGYTGTDYGAGGTVKTGGKNDSAAYVTVHRKLAEKGVYIGGKINTYGRTSCRVSGGAHNLSDRTTVLLADTPTEYPTPSQRSNVTDLISIIGTNDAAASVAAATFNTAYQTEITAWVAAGVQRIYMCTITGRTDADYEAEIDALNAEIRSLVSDNAECYLVDAFTALGGHNILAADLSDGLHLSNQGQRKLGEAIFPVIYSNAT
jgi:lysophospholipase L1-like esterase